MTLAIELQILRGARATIADERNWIKGTFHRNAAWWNPGGPAQYCAAGAVNHQLGRMDEGTDVNSAPFNDLYTSYNRVRARLDIIVQDITGIAGLGVIGYNDSDTTTHADILAVFDKAIAHVEGLILGEIRAAATPLYATAEVTVRDADFGMWVDDRELVAV